MNKNFLYITAGILIAGLFAYLVFRRSEKPASADYFISTEHESNERVANLHLDKPSEDASYILDTQKLVIPKVRDESAQEGYKADPERDWVIGLVPVNKQNISKEDISKIFDAEWRKKFASTLYGFSPKENAWTFADAGDGPEHFSRLKVAIDVQEIYNEEKPVFDPQKLERYIAGLEKQLKNSPVEFKIQQTESIEHAVVKAKALVKFYKEFNRDAIIVLQSNQLYTGAAAWDVLQSVGLQWGDGDLFHWNKHSHFGGDEHFSVWTTTAPGYFLPEEIKSGNMNPKDLIFGFSIPRSADPQNIYDVMLDAAKYCQKRLGGQLLNDSGQRLDEAKQRQEIITLVDKMKSNGLTTGSVSALKTF